MPPSIKRTIRVREFSTNHCRFVMAKHGADSIISNQISHIRNVIVPFFRFSAAACFVSAALSVYAEPNLDRVKDAFSRYEVGEVSETPIDGLYQFNVGTEVYYLSEDGQYLFQGELIDLDTRQNLSEIHRESARKALLDTIDTKDMIVFPAEGERKHVVSVFTDIDCGYCRMLHNHMQDYNKLGIEVRYLAFPRAGIGSEAYQKAVNVWCAADRQKAMTDAKLGREVKSKSCDDPIEQQYNLGVAMGVRGTPALVLESGALVPGFMTPEHLAKTLEVAAQ